MNVGYYVHHHGRGHRQQARAVAAALRRRGVEVAGLSSLSRPSDWPGPWIQLDRDDEGDHLVDVTAGDRLHWVPLHDPGLRGRMATIAEWVRDCAPRAVVVDVSVEVCLLVRLLGVPTLPVLLPGERGDAAHLLALETATAALAFWPPELPDPVRGVPPAVRRKVVEVGGLVERDGSSAAARAGEVALLGGGGGTAITLDEVGAAEQATARTWTVLGPPGPWRDDVPAVLAEAGVVVTHAGLTALAEVAAARRPAVLVPQERPFGEQHAMADALAQGSWPVVRTEGAFADQDWPRLVARAQALDGTLWSGWGAGAADRAAEVVLEAAR